MKKYNRILWAAVMGAVVIGIAGLLIAVPAPQKKAWAADGYRISSALNYAAKKLGIAQSGDSSVVCRNALIQAGVLIEGDYRDYTALMTRTDAAVLASRIMDFMGEEGDLEKYARVKELGRIIDLNKVTKTKRDEVVRVFSDGVITGYSLGQYTQNRNFKGNERLDAAATKRIIRTAMGKGSRKQMSPDGQLIRTTNLPVNASEYPYILENFPNKFYEKKFKYEFSTYSAEPKELKMYTTPVKTPYYSNGKMLEEYRYIWAKKMQKNIELRLNIDYRALDNDWINELASTYASASDIETNKKKVIDIKKYVDMARKNKIVIETKIVSVEPSTMYIGQSLNFRCRIKFRVVSGENISNIGENIMYCEGIYLPGLKVGKWIEGDYDLCIGWMATLNPEGKDGGVSKDGLSIRRMQYKTKILIPKKLKDGSYVFE